MKKKQVDAFLNLLTKYKEICTHCGYLLEGNFNKWEEAKKEQERLYNEILHFLDNVTE